MTQTWSKYGQRSLVLASVMSMALGQGVAQAQTLINTGAIGSKEMVGSGSGLASSANGVSARIETPMQTPVISADDRAPSSFRSISSPVESVVAEKKPLPLNEFQRFVQDTSGKSLPQFGFDFFDQAASPLAQTWLQGAPVGADYRLGPGDELQIKGWGAIDMDVKTVVNREGFITRDDLLKRAEIFRKNDYGRYLLGVASE